jgi:hypothetical protein
MLIGVALLCLFNFYMRPTTPAKGCQSTFLCSNSRNRIAVTGDAQDSKSNEQESTSPGKRRNVPLLRSICLENAKTSHSKIRFLDGGNSSLESIGIYQHTYTFFVLTCLIAILILYEGVLVGGFNWTTIFWRDFFYIVILLFVHVLLMQRAKSVIKEDAVRRLICPALAFRQS